MTTTFAMKCVVSGYVFVREKLSGRRRGPIHQILIQFKKKALFSFVFSAVSLYHQRVFSLTTYLHNQHNVSCFSCDLPVYLPVVESFFKLPKTGERCQPKKGVSLFFSFFLYYIKNRTQTRDGKGGQLVIMLSNAPLAIGSISSIYVVVLVYVIYFL
jgi:hypothetical protein